MWRQRELSRQQQYNNLILAANRVPLVWSALAAAATWLLLAAYLLFPSAVKVVQQSQKLHNAGVVGQFIQATTVRLPVAVLAPILCAISLGVLFYVWFNQRSNCVWVARQIFM